MFSDHLPKIVESPAKTLMLVAAGLGIVGQLVALVMLADGQVEKAQLRDASQASARAVTALCVEGNRGAALNDCDRGTTALAPEIGVNQGKAASQNPPLDTLVNRY